MIEKKVKKGDRNFVELARSRYRGVISSIRYQFQLMKPENLTRIFAHGFTTRKDGHGFGLHSGALVAKELGGALRAESDGPGRGAAFTLELPVKSEVPRS